LYQDFSLLHDSVNYGGNLEVAPPSGGSSRGQVVVGSSPDRSMDESLLNFLDQQGAAALQIDTSWLKVGHVDELITFIPAPKISGKWAILRNSPNVGLKILLEAAKYHFEDPKLTIDGVDWLKIAGNLDSLGELGDKKYVSDVLLGKFWEFYFDREKTAFPEIMPPQVYLRSLSNQINPKTSDKHQVGAARMSILEILRIERASKVNRMAEKERLSALVTNLKSAFSGIEILAVPALLDLPDEAGQTETLLPNLVNMQVIGKYLLIPHPFGPRMNPDGALKVIGKVVPSRFKSLISKSIIQLNKLDQRTLNIKNLYPPGYSLFIGEIVEALGNQGNEEFEEKFFQINRIHFDADQALKDGWHKLKIPEKTVDLFELYTVILLSGVGLKIHWIDTWYYHLRHGGLHCGTNAIRSF
jgi:hypothetical protein